MVVTIDDLFSDIISNFPGDSQKFEFKTILGYIDDAYKKVRDEYVNNGKGEGFSVEESITTFNTSKFSYMRQASLANQVLSNVSLDVAVVNTLVRDAPEVTNPLLVDKTFKAEDVRDYSPGNGIQYFKGDVVYELGEAYKANQKVKATSTDPLSDQDEWDQVFFMEKSVGLKTAEIVSYHMEDRHRVLIDTGVSVVTVLKDTVLVSDDIQELDIEYLPEHTPLTSFDDVIHVPDSARKAIRDMVVSEMIQQIPNTTTSDGSE